MVYPHEHILLRFNGHFGTTGGILDRWSVGLRFGLPAAAPAYDPVKLQTLVDAARAAAELFHIAGGAATGTSTFFDSVTGAQIGVSGKYTPPSQLTVISANTTPVAGVGTPVNPWDSASVISLRTAIPRGRGSNGRVYWPAQALAVTPGTGRVASGLTGSRLSSFKTFVNSLNTAANTYSAGMKLIVASNVGGGLYAYVTGIRSDDRLDSIERRENQQPPVWSTQTIP